MFLKKIRLFLFLTLAFAITSIAGVVIFNTSTYCTVRLLGFESSINYVGVTTCTIVGEDTFYINTLKKYEYEIHKELYFPDKAKFETKRGIINKRATIVYSAAPMVAIIIGTFFFVALFKKYWKRKLVNDFTYKEWAMVFLSFFWGRELLVFILYIKSLFVKNPNFYLIDEIQMLEINHLPLFPFLLLVAILSILVLYSVTFIFIPKSKRILFLIAGLIGTFLGFILWFQFLGPIVLP